MPNINKAQKRVNSFIPAMIARIVSFCILYLQLKTAITAKDKIMTIIQMILYVIYINNNKGKEKWFYAFSVFYVLNNIPFEITDGPSFCYLLSKSFKHQVFTFLRFNNPYKKRCTI